MMTLGPPHSAGREPLAEAITQRRIEQARAAGWPQLERDDLDFGKHWVEHRPTGRFYNVHRGELVDGLYTSAAAFYLDDQGGIRFLESLPAPQPQTRHELEQRRAEREQARAERMKPRARR